MHRPRLTAALYAAITLCTACQHNTIYHQYRQTDLWAWSRDDTVHFSLPRLSNPTKATLTIELRTTPQYPYNNLALQQTIRRGHTIIATDTINIRLYNRQGTTRGTGFPYTTHHKPLPPVHIDPGEDYTVHISHIMKQHEIKGIESIGIRLERQPRQP